MSRLDEILIEKEDLEQRVENLENTTVRLNRMIAGLKIRNSELITRRNELTEENLKLQNELNRIKNMGMYEFANTYCTGEELEDAGHQLARALGVGQ